MSVLNDSFHQSTFLQFRKAKNYSYIYFFHSAVLVSYVQYHNLFCGIFKSRNNNRSCALFTRSVTTLNASETVFLRKNTLQLQKAFPGDATGCPSNQNAYYEKCVLLIKNLVKFLSSCFKFLLKHLFLYLIKVQKQN